MLLALALGGPVCCPLAAEAESRMICNGGLIWLAMEWFPIEAIKNNESSVDEKKLLYLLYMFRLNRASEAGWNQLPVASIIRYGNAATSLPSTLEFSGKHTSIDNQFVNHLRLALTAVQLTFDIQRVRQCQ